MKKTRTKRFIALLLTLMMVFTICGGVFGDDDTSEPETTTGTITITNAQDGVTYTAYKIFDVTLATDEDENVTGYAYTIAVNSEWLTYVQSYVNAESDPTADDTDEEDEDEEETTTWSSGLTLTISAEGSCYVVTFDEDTFSAAKFAKYLLSKLKAAESGTCTGTDGTSNSDGSYTISDLALGYYLVAGTETSEDEDGNTSTTYLGLAELTTTDTDVEIYDKNAAQKIEKDVDANAGSVEIGENISFYIYGTVPSLTGYSSYTYKIEDSMTDGLTFTLAQMAAMDIELYQDDDDSIDMTTEDRDSVQLYVVATSEDGVYSVVHYVLTTDTGVDSETTYYTKGEDSSGNTTYTAVETPVDSSISSYYEAVIVGTLTYVPATGETTDDDGNTVDATGGGFTLDLDMAELQGYVGYEIGIQYKATANENLNATTATNTATLTYSSDPDNAATTSTTSDYETVYTSQIIIYKVDGSTGTTDENGDTSYESATALSGAKFVLIEYKSYSASGLSNLSSGITYYTKDTDEDGNVTYTETGTTGEDNPTSGTYYVIRYYQYTSMEYTTTTDATPVYGTTYYTYDEDSGYTIFSGESFDSDTEYYTRTTGDVSFTTDISKATVLTTDENGMVTIMGLDDLTYYLLETEAPDGYNLLTDTVMIKVAAGDNTLTYEEYVANYSGTILPATGGMGRTILYVIGILIIVCACAALIVRRRVSCRK